MNSINFLSLLIILFFSNAFVFSNTSFCIIHLLRTTCSLHDKDRGVYEKIFWERFSGFHWLHNTKLYRLLTLARHNTKALEQVFSHFRGGVREGFGDGTEKLLVSRTTPGRDVYTVYVAHRSHAVLDRTVAVAMETVHKHSGDDSVRGAGDHHQRMLHDNRLHHLVEEQTPVTGQKQRGTARHQK